MPWVCSSWGISLCCSLYFLDLNVGLPCWAWEVLLDNILTSVFQLGFILSVIFRYTWFRFKCRLDLFTNPISWRLCSSLFTLFSLILPSHFISLSWYSISDILLLLDWFSYWNLCMLHEVLVLYFSASLCGLCSSLSWLFWFAFHLTFSRFLVSLHQVRTCSFSSEKFVFTYLLKPASVNSSNSFSIQFCSLAGEELWSLGGGEPFLFLVISSFMC